MGDCSADYGGDARPIRVHINSLCANGAVERRLKVRRSTESNPVSTKRVKTLAIQAKYSPNKGL
jgi:hypothetical protein